MRRAPQVGDGVGGLPVGTGSMQQIALAQQVDGYASGAKDAARVRNVQRDQAARGGFEVWLAQRS